MRIFVLAALFCADVIAANAGVSVAIGPGVDLIPGAFTPNRQPDGNSLIFRGSDGLVVVDTGRHAEHTQRIIDYAQAAGLPIRAVLNSHWHLDHVGGNPRIRAAYPEVRIYASAAIDGAVHGFLADYRKQLASAIAHAGDVSKVNDWRDEIAIIDAGKALYPDVTIERSQTRRLAGREFEIHLETNAVTAGDIWVFDPASRVLAAGDLVTLPVPFLDTACPVRWKNALDRLAAVKFDVLVPGHGRPMRRDAFETYRRAYAALLACASSEKTKAACSDGWMTNAKPLLERAQDESTRAMLDYYMDTSLRGDPARVGKLCGG